MIRPNTIRPIAIRHFTIRANGFFRTTTIYLFNSRLSKKEVSFFFHLLVLTNICVNENPLFYWFWWHMESTPQWKLVSKPVLKRSESQHMVLIDLTNVRSWDLTMRLDARQKRVALEFHRFNGNIWPLDGATCQKSQYKICLFFIVSHPCLVAILVPDKKLDH